MQRIIVSSNAKKIVVLFILLVVSLPSISQTSIIYDNNGDIHDIFKTIKTRYVIRFPHAFIDTLFVPINSEISFAGGSLSGPIVFNNTSLSGDVNLKGSSIRGSITNNYFDASWICAMDGITDDTFSINGAIEVCNSVYFPKGTYHLISEYDAKGKVPDNYLSSFKCHIGIGKSNVTLKGEPGAVIDTKEKTGILYLYSQPEQIESSISNILIDGLTFKVHNDGETYLGLIHSIKTMGVNGLTIMNCTFNDFWGDAICLSHYGDSPVTGERTRNQNVSIINNNIIGGNHHNTRNGISVISGKNVLIKKNNIISTSRKDKPGGIDIEPNNSAYTVENIQIVNNYFEDIWGSGGAIGVCVYDGGPAYKITIQGYKICNCIEGIQLYIMTDYTTADFVIINNLFVEVKVPMSFEGEGRSRNWSIIGNNYPKLRQQIPGKIRVDHLVVKRNKSIVYSPMTLVMNSICAKVTSFSRKIVDKIFILIDNLKKSLFDDNKGSRQKNGSL